MRNKMIIAASIAMIVASPSFAQGHGGGGGGGGGGGSHGGGMGAGPPISPPGQSGGMGASTRAGDISAQRGEFGRGLADEQRSRMLPEQAHIAAQERRAQALEYAQEARAGRALPANADRQIRNELKDDIDLWRQEFRVGRDEWKAERDRWIVDRESLTSEQWAQRRADWFAARDSWIAANRTTAQARAD